MLNTLLMSTDNLLNLPSFLDFEIAKIDELKITGFRHKWFPIETAVEPQQLLLKPPANKLVNKIIADPLLTLLCLVFEETAELPSQRAQIYQAGLEILLAKWDNKYQCDRDRVYQQLSLQQKLDLLSHIALKTFDSGECFLQPELEQHIAEYLRYLPNAPVELEVLQLDSQAVLKAIAAQHGLLVECASGIYAFADFSFQQYFAARGIVNHPEPQALEQALQHLASQIAKPLWREVFLFAVGIMQNADYLLSLIRQQTNALVAVDAQLRDFLAWLNRKSYSDFAFCQPPAFRALYLELIIGLDSKYKNNRTHNFQARRYKHSQLQSFPFSQAQKQILQQYYDANQLLLDCLKQAHYVTHNLREEIEQNLLAPLESSNETGSAIA